jgi:hypothetical protein
MFFTNSTPKFVKFFTDDLHSIDGGATLGKIFDNNFELAGFHAAHVFPS